MTRDERLRRGLAGAGLLLALSQALRPLYAPDAAYPPFDLIHFWRAGVMWAEGASPYDPAYAAAALPDDYLARPFFYPPAARVLFEPLAAWSFEAARTPYTLLAAALWGLVCWLTARALPLGLPLSLRAAGLALLMAFALPQVRLATEGGQVTVLMVAAVAGLLAALRASPSGASPGVLPDTGLAACVFVLMLKPPLGLALCLVLALRRARWRALALATVAVLLATLHGSQGRPDLALAAYVANAGLYDTFLENGPQLTSGLGALLFALGLPAPGGLVLALLAVATGAALGLARRVPLADALLLAVAASLLLLPSHSYDYLILLAFLPRLMAARGAAARLLAVAALLLAQASATARTAQALGLIHQENPDGAGYLFTAARIDTLGIVLFALGAALLVAGVGARKGAERPAPAPLRVPG